MGCQEANIFRQHAYDEDVDDEVGDDDDDDEEDGDDDGQVVLLLLTPPLYPLLYDNLLP